MITIILTTISLLSHTVYLAFSLSHTDLLTWTNPELSLFHTFLVMDTNYMAVTPSGVRSINRPPTGYLISAPLLIVDFPPVSLFDGSSYSAPFVFHVALFPNTRSIITGSTEVGYDIFGLLLYKHGKLARAANFSHHPLYEPSSTICYTECLQAPSRANDPNILQDLRHLVGLKNAEPVIDMQLYSSTETISNLTSNSCSTATYYIDTSCNVNTCP